MDVYTKIYTKPTDASRYLNRRSDHSPHTFVGIPFSQFRRATVLCSKEEDKYKCIEYISEKLLNSDFQQDEVENAKKRMLLLKRSDIICLEAQLKSLMNAKHSHF